MQENRKGVKELLRIRDGWHGMGWEVSHNKTNNQQPTTNNQQPTTNNNNNNNNNQSKASHQLLAMIKPSSPDESLVSADDWFAGGRRVHFDPNHKKMRPEATANTIPVFERVQGDTTSNKDSTNYDAVALWLTLLPGFPDGSYGYAKMEHYLEEKLSGGGLASPPRLYVEYVGQGDSETPEDYHYSTVERADLVEAQWQAHGVQRTVVTTFDYSSIVLLELLRRQQERQGTDKAFTRIEHVLLINGGLYADGHTHPWTTTPLLQTRVGKMGAHMAQRSNFMLDTMLKPLYSSHYRKKNRRTQKWEMRETEKAIRRHHGARFLSDAASFVDEHLQNASRWNLSAIYLEYCQQQGITIEVVGSEEDPFEWKQVVLVRERLGSCYPSVRTDIIPGGHWSTAEQAPALATRALALVRKGQQPNSETPAWTQDGLAKPSSATRNMPWMRPTVRPTD
jgi:pimeloyl-ACP methyl ester carboxylesterase